MSARKIFCFVLISNFAIIALAQECGVVKYSSELIYGGEYSKRGQWPWLCTLHDTESEEFFCGSTLISTRHIVTAAHCFWSKGNFAPSHTEKNTFVAAGKYDLRYFENTAQRRNVARVKIHPDWKANAESFDADIAVATLEYPVSITTSVIPICLPNFNSVLIHPIGTVVGWGKSETSGPNKQDHESIPKQIEVRAVTNDECFLSYSEFTKISSHRTYCAGWPGQGVGPCHGDSGGGFYYKVGNTWFIQGIVSATVIDNGRCDVSKYSVYTNVLKLADWVRDAQRENIEVAFNDIDLNCKFVRNFEGLYGCEVTNLVIDSPNYRIANVPGQHVDGNSVIEVEYVWIKESRVTHLPRFDAQVFFPNIQKYLVTGSHLKFVKRDDFGGMPKLQTIYLDDNDIEVLPEDMLYDLNLLVDFFIEKNKLRVLPTYLLNHAPDFQRFRAANNSIEELPRDFFKNNNILKIVTLDNNKLQRILVDFLPYKNLKKIDLLNNTCVNTNFNDWRKHKSIPIVQDEINKGCR